MKSAREKTQIISTSGGAGDFHARPIPHTLHPQIWIHHLWRPSVVLGSTQKPDIVDAQAISRAGYELTKRRSGGGLVIVHPDTSVWIDVIIPTSHPLWCDDVGKAFHWVGKAWADALETASVPNPRVHSGPPSNPDLGRVLCFGSTGSGEVESESSKVVGLSQRRTRHGARFQGIAVQGFDQSELARFMKSELPDLGDLRIGAPFERYELRTAVVKSLEAALRGDGLSEG